jgi:hypothetical protein
VLPTLLTERLHTQEQVCEHARRNHPDKAFALVAIKSHVCDFAGRACLRATRDVSDTCNSFVQAHFATYHSRAYRNTPDGAVRMQENPLAWNLADEWSHDGPVFVVVDVRSCRRLGVVVAPGGGMGHGPVKLRGALARYRALRTALLGLPGVREAVRGFKEFDPHCVEHREPSVMQVWVAMERQRGGD